MNVSAVASAWLCGVLADAGEVLTTRAPGFPGDLAAVVEVRSVLQGWRDQLTGEAAPLVSRALVERAYEEIKDERRGNVGRASVLLNEALGG